MVVVVVVNIRLCTWDRADRECSSGKGGQNESKFSHAIDCLGWFTGVQRMAVADPDSKSTDGLQVP